MPDATPTPPIDAAELRRWLSSTGWTAVGKGALTEANTWTTTRPGLCWHRSDGPRHYRLTLDRGGVRVEQRSTAGAWSTVVYARWGTAWHVPQGVQLGGRCVVAACAALGRALHGLEPEENG